MRFMDEQKNWEWYRARWGKITSTRVQPLISGSNATLNKLLETLWAEWDATEDAIMRAYEMDQMESNRFMKWGTQHEEEAITAFEIARSVDTIRPGFIEHRQYPELMGTSIDFIEVNVDGEMIRPGEAKCPYYERRHYENVRKQKYIGNHRHQMQHHIAVLRSIGAEPDGCRFVSYHPKVDEEDDRLFDDLVPPIHSWHEQLRTMMRSFSKKFYARELYFVPKED